MAKFAVIRAMAVLGQGHNELSNPVKELSRHFQILARGLGQEPVMTPGRIMKQTTLTLYTIYSIAYINL